MSDTVTFVNSSGSVVNGIPLGLGEIQPGAEVEVPIEVCAAGRRDNGSRKKSPIEQVCPALKPKDPAFEAAWKRVPDPAPVISKIVSVSGREPAIPAGVVAARKAKAEAEAAKMTAKPPVK